ncbi:aldehyde dehydrogenase [Mycena albidolilacea]|uniref:Aldehyde dehydrogenase n=1 Tax=Mycena albidolilacea TaxID=1033008 RepID=A0AAD6YY42_9AGAR|nr:aldehyde dehydrogenase [Mycena albidolilacea]
MQITPILEIEESLRENFRAGVSLPVEWRKQQLLQLARMVQENAPAFTEGVSKDMGKPKTETYFAEIAPIAQHSLVSAEKLDEDWQKPWPWNYPLILSLQPLIGAIAAGCCAVLKLSEIAPHYSALLSELAPKYLGSSAFKIVLGSVPGAAELLELQFFYNGNSRIARIIATAAARHLTSLTLKLGDKCPVIVDLATDIAIAAKRILWGKAQNFLLSIFPDGSLASDSISLIVSPGHHSRLMDLLKRTKGEVVLGGKSQDLKIEITVVKNVSANDSLMEGLSIFAELFGPILPIVPVDSIQDAIDFVRERHHPLVLYAFTEIPKVKTQLLNGTFSGSLVFNDTFQQLAVNELPLGGVGESGHGRQTLKYTFDEFSYERASIDLPKEAEPFLGIRYAPYTQENFKIMAAPAFMQIPEKI